MQADSTRLDSTCGRWQKLPTFHIYSSIAGVYVPLRKKLSYVCTNITTIHRHRHRHRPETISSKAIAIQFMLKHWGEKTTNLTRKKPQKEDIEIEKEEEEEGDEDEDEAKRRKRKHIRTTNCR